METPKRRGRPSKAGTAAKAEVKAEVKAKAEPKKTEIGKVTHFFTNLSVAVIELSKPLKVGDTISIEGATTKIQQKVESMQIGNKVVKEAKAGETIGMKVKDRVREHDIVYKL